VLDLDSDDQPPDRVADRFCPITRRHVRGVDL
jgi:hypothetical protein